MDRQAGFVPLPMDASMARRRGHPCRSGRQVAGLLCLLALAGGLFGCGPSPEEQREAAERERQQQQARAQLERCRRDRPAIIQLSQALERHSRDLKRLNAERYLPAPRPEPPDPALAARFTQADQELDELRYRERLRTWQAAEQARYARWLDEQRSRRERLRTQVGQDASQLRRLAPELLKGDAGSTLLPEAVARAGRCDPADFGVQDKAEGSSSRAAAN